MPTALTVQPLDALTAAAVSYSAADAGGNRLKWFDGTTDFQPANVGGLLVFIRNTSGVLVTAAVGTVPGQLSVPAGATMLFGPLPAQPNAPQSAVDITWSSVTGVSVAVFDAVDLGRSRSIPLTAIPNVSTDVVTIAWSFAVAGLPRAFPSWATFDLQWRRGMGPGAVTTIAGITSPYSHLKTGTGGHGLDLIDLNAINGTLDRLCYSIVMRNANGVAVGGGSLVLDIRWL